MGVERGYLLDNKVSAEKASKARANLGCSEMETTEEERGEKNMQRYANEAPLTQVESAFLTFLEPHKEI